jgi:hypothetical protein
MKKAVVVGLGCAVSSLFSRAHGAPIKEPDYGLVNETIESALTEIMPEYQSLLDHFNYSFDAQTTSLEKNEFLINLEGALKETPWDETKALNFSADFGFKIDVPPKKEAVEIFISKSLDTDGVELMKYIAREHSPCPVPDAVQGVKRIAQEQDCENVPAILASQNVEQLKGVFENHINRTTLAIEAYLASLERENALVRSPQVKGLLSKELAHGHAILKGIKTARVESTKQGFLMSARDIQFNDQILIKDISLRVENTNTLLSVTLRAPVGSDLYLAAKPEIERVLKALEEGQLYAKEIVKMKSRVWLNFIQRKLAPDAKQVAAE